MRFGAKNAPAIFQTLTEEVLDGLGFVKAYMDDLIIFSDSCEEHELLVTQVLGALTKAGLIANSEKCQ